MLQVIFEKILDTAKIPTKGSEYAACWDVYAAEDCRVCHGQVAKVRTGLRVNIPHDYMIHVKPRSGLAIKAGVDVLAGVIDSDYRGELIVALTTVDDNRNNWTYISATEPIEDDQRLVISVGDRVAQIQLLPVPEWECIEGDVDIDTGRGTGGFGSTGE